MTERRLMLQLVFIVVKYYIEALVSVWSKPLKYCVGHARLGGRKDDTWAQRRRGAGAYRVPLIIC